MNENLSRTLRDDPRVCEKDAYPFRSGLNAEGVLQNAFEHDCPIGINDLSTAKVQNPVVPSAVVSDDKDLPEKKSELYTDKRIAGCGPPESIVCYMEPTYRVLKDICIAEGEPSEDKITIEIRKDEHAGFCDCQAPIDEEISELSKGKMSGIIRLSDGRKLLVEENCVWDDGSRKSTVVCEANKIAADIGKETIIPNVPKAGWLVVENFRCDLSNLSGNEVEQESIQIPSQEVIVVSPARSSASEEMKDSCRITDKLSYGGKRESGSITFLHESSGPVASGRDNRSEIGNHKHFYDAPSMSRLEDRRHSDDVLTTPSLLHHCPGETSFNAAGSLPGSITYTEPILNSGSISLRSESSTTSTRSFAFPILQAEWNSSPVRMAKADRRHFQKRKVWMQDFLCCRF